MMGDSQKLKSANLTKEKSFEDLAVENDDKPKQRLSISILAGRHRPFEGKEEEGGGMPTTTIFATEDSEKSELSGKSSASITPPPASLIDPNVSHLAGALPHARKTIQSLRRFSRRKEQEENEIDESEGKRNSIHQKERRN